MATLSPTPPFVPTTPPPTPPIVPTTPTTPPTPARVTMPPQRQPSIQKWTPKASKSFIPKASKSFIPKASKSINKKTKTTKKVTLYYYRERARVRVEGALASTVPPSTVKETRQRKRMPMFTKYDSTENVVINPTYMRTRRRTIVPTMTPVR